MNREPTGLTEGIPGLQSGKEVKRLDRRNTAAQQRTHKGGDAVGGIEQRIPPQNLDAERAVLGAMLLEREAITRAVNHLTADDFYARPHQLIFQAILRLYEQDVAVDPITLANELSQKGQLEAVGGEAYLSELVARIQTTANVEEYAKIVKDHASRRRALSIARTLQDQLYDGSISADEVIVRAQQELLKVATSRSAKGYIRLSDAVLNAYYRVETLSQYRGRTTGVPTGFKDLDRITSGWQPSDLIIVAARPSVGKTAFTLNLARNAAKQGAKVVFFSLEMNADQLALRLLASEAAVDGMRLRNGQIEGDEWERIIAGMDSLADLDLFVVDEPNMPFADVRATARRIHAEHGADLIIVDYLQLMSGSGRRHENRQQEVSEISRGLKALARELRVPVIAISQLSRSVEQRQDKRPILSDLRESGSIEQDADVVIFLYRDDYYNQHSDEAKGIVDVIVAKQRNGPVDTIQLYFVKEIQKFFDLDRKHAA